MDRTLLERWLDQAADGLAYAIVASCSVIDFELVVIDGWLPEQARSELVTRTAQKLPEFNLAPAFGTTSQSDLPSLGSLSQGAGRDGAPPAVRR